MTVYITQGEREDVAVVRQQSPHRDDEEAPCSGLVVAREVRKNCCRGREIYPVVAIVLVKMGIIRKQQVEPYEAGNMCTNPEGRNEHGG